MVLARAKATTRSNTWTTAGLVDAYAIEQRRLRPMIGLPLATFTAFLPDFSAAMERYLARYTINLGKVYVKDQQMASQSHLLIACWCEKVLLPRQTRKAF